MPLNVFKLSGERSGAERGRSNHGFGRELVQTGSLLSVISLSSNTIGEICSESPEMSFRISDVVLA